jgi:hypothetical protein
MAPPVARLRIVEVDETDDHVRRTEMHPLMTQELARIKIAEQVQYAERQRLAKLAVSDRPRPIDFVKIGQGLRERLFGRPAAGPAKPAEAGA